MVEKSAFTKHYDAILKLSFDLLDVKTHNYIITSENTFVKRFIIISAPLKTHMSALFLNKTENDITLHYYI